MGVGRLEMGCGCDCDEAELAACEDCCTGGMGLEIKVSIGEVFESVEGGCDTCDTLNDVDVFLEEFVDCNWLLYVGLDCDSTNPFPDVVQYTVTYTLLLFKPEEGDCQVTFTISIDGDFGGGFNAVTVAWYGEFTETENCTSISLAHQSTFESDTACNVVESPPNVTVYWNP